MARSHESWRLVRTQVQFPCTKGGQLTTICSNSLTLSTVCSGTTLMCSYPIHIINKFFFKELWKTPPFGHVFLEFRQMGNGYALSAETAQRSLVCACVVLELAYA